MVIDMAKAPKSANKHENFVRLDPPRGGAAVRMYRIGHGDCFLIAFDGGGDRPVFVMIDCGYKPGSPDFLSPKLTNRADRVAKDILAVTEGRIDVGVITHEHQDHLNGITEPRYRDLKIDEVWLAWTESETDELARRLRIKHHDTLAALAGARAALSGSELADVIDELASLELGGEGKTVPAHKALAASGGWTNKSALRFFRTRSEKPPRVIYPHQQIIPLTASKNVRVFALGPPYDEDAIDDLDPRKSESFPSGITGGHAIAPTLSAALTSNGSQTGQPFSPRHSEALGNSSSDSWTWFRMHYGQGRDSPKNASQTPDETADNAEFRRIDNEWRYSAERLALAMGNDTNNSSLVLAFELGKGGKVLLFAGDAQRGNWASWANKTFEDGDRQIQVKELLGRTVLYKVGHHGSHNATLNGKASDTHPNLSWLGRGRYGDEFTSMITAVRAWATQKSVGWDHPLPSIKEALLDKCGGRVLQTDTDVVELKKPDDVSEQAWSAFLSRVNGDSPLYFDYFVHGD